MWTCSLCKTIRMIEDGYSIEEPEGMYITIKTR